MESLDHSFGDYCCEFGDCGCNLPQEVRLSIVDTNIYSRIFLKLYLHTVCFSAYIRKRDRAQDENSLKIAEKTKAQV